MKVAIYGRITEKKLPEGLQPLFDKLGQHEIELLLTEDFQAYLEQGVTIRSRVKTLRDYNEMRGQADYLLTLGGDGTLLETIAFVRNSGIPVLGINTGRLGFLAAVSVEEAGRELVERLVKRDYTIDKRSLVKLETQENLFGEVNYALNEFTLQRKDSSAMMTIHATVNGQFLNSYWADGLIIATPTGSTAYSLSCGGPLVVPDAKSFIITPLSPHNLNVRPLIIPDDSVIELQVEGRSSHYLTTLDARMETVPCDTKLTIRKEDFKISLIRFNDKHFFQIIREKLLWGHDKRN